MTFDERARLMRDGMLRVPSQYGEPTPITRALIEDGRDHLLLDGPIVLDCQSGCCTARRDPDVPWELALRTAEQLMSRDVRSS